MFRGVDVLLGVLLGVVLTASALAVAGWRRRGGCSRRARRACARRCTPRRRRCRTCASGLTRESAGKAIGHLHALTQAAGVLIDDGEKVLAADGLPAATGPTGCRTPSA